MTEEETGRDPLSTLGEFIRQQRQGAELSLRELAAKANVSNPYISQIERGLHEPSVRVLKAIAGALNLSAETLLAQAGLLDGPDGEAAEPEPPDTEAVIQGDPRLDQAQRDSLLTLYRSYVA